MPNQTPIMDPARSVLLRAEGLNPQDQQSAWEHYHQASNEDDLAARLQNSPLPQQVKHDLWEAKHVTGLLKASNTSLALAGGDEDLAGVARATKIVTLAKRNKDVAQTLDLAKEHPWLAKIITEKPESNPAQTEPKTDKIDKKPVSRAVQKDNLPAEASADANYGGAQAGAATPRIYFQSSDGQTHSVPADQIHEAMKIDPKLTIINQ